MAEVRPFNGVRYNQSLVKDLAAVICPPYDIISPELQQELYQRSEYNYVRLEYARGLPNDNPEDNKFTRSAATLEQWLKKGVLKADDAPAIYLHDHIFTHGVRKYKRRGIFARVRLEEWDKMVVRPHEGTLSKPKGERLNLMWACQADISPVLAMYEDAGKRISHLLASQAGKKPAIDIGNVDGEGHRLWVIKDSEAIQLISKSLAAQPLYIADGHHRYESALDYRRQRVACSGTYYGDEPFNFVMMALVNFSDPGLLILPVHRLVRGVPASTLDRLMSGLESFFSIEEVPIKQREPSVQINELLGAGDDVRMGLFGLTGESFLLLRLRDEGAVGAMVPCFHSQLYNKLDVSIVDHVILGKLLGWDARGVEENPAYSHDTAQAMERVSGGEFQLAVLVRPVRAQTIKAVADAGDRMPRKSTYFYPKAPSGLVFYRKP